MLSSGLDLELTVRRVTCLGYMTTDLDDTYIDLLAWGPQMSKLADDKNERFFRLDDEDGNVLGFTANQRMHPYWLPYPQQH
jgi:hypothetical protein